jgi:hypothetical protein
MGADLTIRNGRRPRNSEWAQTSQFGMGADLAIRNGRRPHNSEWAQTLRPYLTPAIVEVL